VSLDGTGRSCYVQTLWTLGVNALARFSKLLLPVVVLCCAAVSACAGYPMQQKSDATQAVRAAQKAGAAQYAPDLLSEAQAHLDKGRVELQGGEYRSARDEFELARSTAIEARRAAEAATGAPKP
jgi:hypothetical protein